MTAYTHLKFVTTQSDRLIEATLDASSRACGLQILGNFPRFFCGGREEFGLARERPLLSRLGEAMYSLALH